MILAAARTRGPGELPRPMALRSKRSISPLAFSG